MSSSMSAAMDCFRDLLPSEVELAQNHALVRHTLAEIPQVFMRNGFGIEHDIAHGVQRGCNTLSVSIATELPGVGRLNLSRFVDKYLQPWLSGGRFRDVILRAWQELGRYRSAAIFPERCYFGFEVAEAQSLRIAGVVWSYFMHADKLREVALSELFAQLLGSTAKPQHPSILRLTELCGETPSIEIGYGIRGSYELFKAYPAMRFETSAPLLDHFDSEQARGLRAALTQLGVKLPKWDCFCPMDVVDGELVRLGFELNFEEPNAREHYLPVLLESTLMTELFPPHLREALGSGIAGGRVIRVSPKGERCSFEITHLKVSIDHHKQLRWKVYFAFRLLDVYPTTVPIMMPWVIEAVS